MTSQHQLALLIVLASIGVTVLQATDLGCRPGEKLYQGRCYGVYRPSPKCPHDFNQTAAEDFCQANGGELASIHSQAQNDFITALIKSTQHAAAKKAAAKAKCGGCQVPEKDYLYWIGLELSHRANGTVNGASWTDGTAVNYGNPTSAAFRPPFVTGRPVGSAGDGRDPLEVCPLGNENKCVQIYGYGSTIGKWTDKHCANQHVQNVTCGCPAAEEEEAGNRTLAHRHPHHHSSSSSSSAADEEDVIDECRDEAALNGLVCQSCPLGWTPFQGHCYLAIDGGLATASHATCEGYGAAVSSIHSAAENVFVLNLGQAHAAGANNLIGLTMTHASNAQNAPVTSAQWSDSTSVDYGNPMVAPWSARGVYPWGTGSISGFPQPDNVPAPGNCVFMYGPGSNFQGPGEWEDLPCAGLLTGVAVCKLQ